MALKPRSRGTLEIVPPDDSETESDVVGASVATDTTPDTQPEADTVVKAEPSHPATPPADTPRRRVSPISDFKLDNLYITLPSGATVRMGRVSLGTLIATGRIPNPLVPMALKIVEDRGYEPGKADGEEREHTEDDEIEEQRQYWAVIDAMVVGAVQEPRLVLNESEETDDTVWVGRLIDADKMTVYWRVGATLAWLAPFRDGAAS